MNGFKIKTIKAHQGAITYLSLDSLPKIIIETAKKEQIKVNTSF
jgi:hypothetical protein